MEYRNVTHLVKSKLLEGQKSYKEIANEGRKRFPLAKTTDKSVASVAREMRKEGLIKKREPKRVYGIQIEMFN